METLDLELLEYFGQIMGERAEIVVHDYHTGEILWMHGNLTGRTVGEINDPQLIRKLEKNALDKKSHAIVGYRSMSESKIPLRSSIKFLLRENEPSYVVCVNEDISDFVQMEHVAQRMMGPAHDGETLAAAAQGSVENTVDAIIQEVITSVVPYSIQERATKLRILKKLDEKGVLKVRHVMPKVCAELNINQSTYYKYLKEIRT